MVRVLYKVWQVTALEQDSRSKWGPAAPVIALEYIGFSGELGWNHVSYALVP